MKEIKPQMQRSDPNQMLRMQTSALKRDIAEFQYELTKFYNENEKEIDSNKELRKNFFKMCIDVGIDPMLCLFII